MQSLQCTVSGVVQGVNFRSWTKSQAENLNIKGWVRNLSDGRVEVLAQGSEDSLEELKKRLFNGPTMSRVEDVQCEWIDYDKEHSAFELRL
ncbi:MAG: acylphosphatase [Desulfohalobiaceae bacterium]